MDDTTEENDNKKARLLEIYKSQSQIINDISNRRLTANRYYILVMSGLILAFATLLQTNNEGKVKELLDEVTLEWLMVTVGLLGIALSWAWCRSIDAYLRLNSRRYEVLKDLESYLDYPFIANEWDMLGPRKDKTYRQLSNIELSVPYIFYILFTSIFSFGIWRLQNTHFRWFLAVPVLLILVYVLFLCITIGKTKGGV